MPKAKPVSLHPLSFDEAIKALMSVNQKTQKKPSSSKKKSKLDYFFPVPPTGFFTSGIFTVIFMGCACLAISF